MFEIETDSFFHYSPGRIIQFANSTLGISMDKVKKIFHLLMIVYNVVLFSELFRITFSQNANPNLKIVQKLVPRYCTNWNIVMQMVFFVSCVLYDFSDSLPFGVSEKTRSRMKNLMDYWFFALCLPISLVIAILFWSLFTYDHLTIYPTSDLRELMPNWINHGLHTNILAVTFLEMLLVPRTLPSLISSIIGMSVFSIIYGLCIMVTYLEMNIWVYPIYGRLTWFQQQLLNLLFFTACVSSVFVTRFAKFAVDFLIRSLSHRKHYHRDRDNDEMMVVDDVNMNLVKMKNAKVAIPTLNGKKIC